MSVARRAWQRLLAVVRAGELDRDLDEELQTHVALAADEYVQRGMPREEAERLARLRLGGAATARDVHRAARGLPWLEGALFDLRLALRGLRRDWLFSLAAGAMLALALALNTTIFTVRDAMLFRGFPYVKDNSRLLYLQEHFRVNPCCQSYANFEDWRAEAQSFEALAYIGSGRPIPFRDDSGPLDLPVFTVSSSLFTLLGVPPQLGRDFVAADEAPGAAKVALITGRFWNTRYGRRPDIVGLTVELNGTPATIV